MTMPLGPARRTASAWLLLSLVTADLSAQDVTALEQLAERAIPAVVLIDVRTAADTRQGSGFIVDPSGRILTNYHVMRDARSARIRLASGDVYEVVEVLAEDPLRDIAVLQIPGFDLPWLEMGNSDSLRVGSPVVLIGSPLGLENTVSTGIVSGRRREPEGFQLLQVSAPASQGSSGGAVLNAEGRVVGIAVSQMEGGQNLNFAVPVNYARGLLTHLGSSPVTVLRPSAREADEGEARPTVALANAVNQSFKYDLTDFHGYRAESDATLRAGLRRNSRVTFRLIEALGTSEPRIEQYRESETTRVTEPFGTIQSLQRERSRVVVRVGGLSPVSVTGEAAWWNGSNWVTARHDLRFENDRVVGVISDTTGRTIELDRDVPRGILLHDMRDLAFALLDVDALVGRSVEFVTFDPWTGQVGHERFDVQDTVSVEVAGRRHRALEVNVAKGLENETLVVQAQPPRIVLRRIGDRGAEAEEVTLLEIFRGAPNGREPP